MKVRISFLWVLAVIGTGLLVLTAVDLMVFGTHRFPEARRWSVVGGDAERGRHVIIQHGCGACHVIPGIRNAAGRVGPKLEELGDQIYIGGVLANTPENLVQWILDPMEVNPLTAMPTLDMTEQEARDAAAYLYANP